MTETESLLLITNPNNNKLKAYCLLLSNNNKFKVYYWLMRAASHLVTRAELTDETAVEDLV